MFSIFGKFMHRRVNNKVASVLTLNNLCGTKIKTFSTTNTPLCQFKCLILFFVTKTKLTDVCAKQHKEYRNKLLLNNFQYRVRVYALFISNFSLNRHK